MKLVIETSNRQASMVVEKNGQICEFQMENDSRQSSHLLPMVEQNLSSLSIEPKDIDSFYVHIGPGSSTGLRMGVAMAQGWAAVFPKVKFFAVKLEEMALAALNDWNPDCAQAYLLSDAFAGQVFIQSYVKSGNRNRFVLEGDLNLTSLNALENIKTDAAIIEDLGVLKTKQSWPESLQWSDQLFPNAKWTYKAGLVLKESSEIEKIDVRYLKPTSAELRWKAKEK